MNTDWIASKDEPILITGATGFIGPQVVSNLIDRGFRNLRCLVRPGSDMQRLDALSPSRSKGGVIDAIKGNLLSREDCAAATRDVAVIFHLATSRDGKSYPDAFLNSVVTTRNLLDAAHAHGALKRFVNISSLAVYTNTAKSPRRLLNESAEIERHPELRGDAYCFAKVKQDELTQEYGDKFGINYVIVRPGYVIGPGKAAITSRVGIDTFGVFLHLGGSNQIPITFVDNCADAIVLAGLTPGVDGEVFNVVDDDLPSSRRFIRLYKRHVRRFTSLYVPHAASYLLCAAWERYSNWSHGQLPLAFTRRTWHAYWKKTRYTNAKLKRRVGWVPRVSMDESLTRYFQACREDLKHA